MSEPVLLDAYCGVGGAGTGYARTGFRVVGVDIAPQPDYPFEFHEGDALEFIRKYGGDFDAIHSSPPCQASCALTSGTNYGRWYPQLIPATREECERTGKLYVIENVQGADLYRDLTLCGEMFGLGVIRHRYFEFGGWTITEPIAHKPHRGRVRGWRHGTYYAGPYVAVYGDGGGKGSVAEWREAMGIDWTEERLSLAEAIPPAYTEYVGKWLRTLLERE